MDKPYASSHGEELIEEFLQEKDIKFKREEKITKLKDDYADYRVADFYLTKYKIYLEFFGRWNVDVSKEKYRKKKEIYDKNNIPCVYIYPDNLGILEFIFYRRIRGVLKKHPELKFQLFKFNLDLLLQNHLFNILIPFGALIYFINNWTARIVFSLILIISLYQAIKSTFLK